MAAHEQKSPKGNIWHDQLFSTLYACPNCKLSYEELEPRTFSFNSPYGACPVCEGLGARVAFDPELVLPDAARSLADGAVVPWKGEKPGALKKIKEHLKPFLAKAGIAWDTPLEKLSPKLRGQLLHGSGIRSPGVLGLLEKEYAGTTSETKRRRLDAFRGEVVCKECGGSRLRPEARNVFFAGRAIHEITAMTVGALKNLEIWRLEDLEIDGSKSPNLQIAQPIVSEILARLDFLARVGLDYLTLDRPANTLSGGELQRVRLAAGLGSGLVGVCYVLDEPSIGLHPRDNGRLIDAVGRLQSRGNTVVVVEHDEAITRRADWIVDLGPKAGRHGGCVVAQGTPEQIVANDQSLTGRYLAGTERIPLPKHRPPSGKVARRGP